MPQAELLRARARRLMPSRCTIQVTTESRDTFGSTSDAWANVTGLVDIPCRVSVPGSGERPMEVRRADGAVSTETHRIRLDNHYPAITTKHQAVVDGTAYNILAVDHGPDAILTTLHVERVTP